MKTNLSRRRFTLGLGAGLLAAPLLGLLNGTLRADTSKHAKRLIVFFSPNGTIHKHWRPSGSGANFSFPAGSVLEPLAAHKGEIIVCDGIDFHGVDNHEAGMANMLTGGGGASTTSAGMSVDQYIASKIGQDDKFQSLDLGVQTSAWGGNTQTRMSYLGPGTFVPPDDSPKSVFKRMFGDISGDPGAVDKALARRKSIIDLVSGEISGLQKRVGAEEKLKLDEHLAAIRKVETGLQGPVGCDAPPAPLEANEYDNANFGVVGKAQMDLMVLALSCGMTRVASIQWAHTVAPHVFSWLGISEAHHSLSHMDDANTSGVSDFVKAERWFAEQFAYLLQSLKNTPDPMGGTMMDSTLVVWCKELGDGRLHDCKSVPWVVAGGGGHFTTGKYVNFSGAPHQKLLVSICQAMGLENQTFGDPTKGTGVLDGLA
jgi:hypothetical protein